MWRHDKSWIENFLSSWTVLLLAVMSVTSLLLRYVRDPISCHYIYPKANEYFTESCFQETSIIMWSDEFVEFVLQSSSQDIRAKDYKNPFEMWPKQRTYHQWVPFAFGIAAILCLLPHVIWRMVSGFLWLDTHTLVQTITNNQCQNAEERHMTMRASGLVVNAGLKGGNWMLTAATMARKVLACVVCVVLLVLIVVVFKPPLGGSGQREKTNINFNVTPPEAVEDVPLPADPFFCVVNFLQRSNQQSFMLQCLLPLNTVFIKAFTFLFYFFLLLLVLNLWDILYWSGRLFLPHLRDVTLLRHLSVFSQSEGSGSSHFSTFLQTLGLDGRLLLAMVADHCGPVAALDFTNQMWQVFMGASPQPVGSSTEAQSWNSTGAGSSMRGKKDKDAHKGADIPLQVVGESHPTDDDTAKLC